MGAQENRLMEIYPYVMNTKMCYVMGTKKNISMGRFCAYVIFETSVSSPCIVQHVVSFLVLQSFC